MTDKIQVFSTVLCIYSKCGVQGNCIINSVLMLIVKVWYLVWHVSVTLWQCDSDMCDLTWLYSYLGFVYVRVHCLGLPANPVRTGWSLSCPVMSRQHFDILYKIVSKMWVLVGDDPWQHWSKTITNYQLKLQVLFSQQHGGGTWNITWTPGNVVIFIFILFSDWNV